MINTTQEQRKLFIKKDLIELSQWIDMLEAINVELDNIQKLEAHVIQNKFLLFAIQALRRKNTLLNGAFCRYEQQLLQELKYGTREYTLIRAKEHEGKRNDYTNLILDFRELKQAFYKILVKFKCK